ncbi:MAG: M10 family metallopeptidase C-terminal domain-containing protein, partial [Chloroflexi bacterium]|nr:M10 family metallopeptidase C-terminal domain-containing protein [Chloroflexota bacterium]
YLFDADSALGTDTITELAVATGGTDTLDFSETTDLAVSIRLAEAALQTVNANLSIDLSAADVIENVIGGSLGDSLQGNSLDNLLAGGAGDDTYLFADSWGTDLVAESSGAGADTMDFSLVTAGALTFTVSGSTSGSSGTDLATHAGDAMEALVGGQQSDAFNVTPSLTIPFTLDGSGGAQDVLNFDAEGLAVVQTPNTLTASGKQSVTFTGFETVNVLNPA